MRSALFALLLPLLFGCLGGDNTVSCKTGFQIGTWSGVTSSDSVIFDSACAFTYTTAGNCTSKGKYAKPLQESGTVSVNITTAGTGGTGDCLSSGAHDCDYVFLTSDTFTLDCGIGTIKYQKKN